MDADQPSIQQVPPASPVEKTILASILEMSNVNDKWVQKFASAKKEKKRKESLFECSWRFVGILTVPLILYSIFSAPMSPHQFPFPIAIFLECANAM